MASGGEKILGGVVTVRRQSMVSFGRRVIPVNDRAAERKAIQEKRRRIDNLIAGGLRSAGIEVDGEDKRIQKMLYDSSAHNSTG